MHNKLAQEAKVNFCSNFFIDSLINVIILVGRFGFTTLKMLVKLIVILEKEEKYFAGWIRYQGNVSVTLWNYWVSECPPTNKHALQYVNYLDFQLRIWNFLVNRYQNIQCICLVFNMIDAVELWCQDPNYYNKQWSPCIVALDVFLFVVLFITVNIFFFDQFDIDF